MPLPFLFQYSAVAPGPFGNLVYFMTAPNAGGPNFIISVSGPAVLLTIGTTGGNWNLNWSAYAAALNADPSASLVGVAVGDTTGAGAPYFPFTSALVDGTYGQGLGQFYFIGSAPPPVTLEVNVVFFGTVRFLIKDTAAKVHRFAALCSALLSNARPQPVARYLLQLKDFSVMALASLLFAIRSFESDPPNAITCVLWRCRPQPVARYLLQLKDFSVMRFASPLFSALRASRAFRAVVFGGRNRLLTATGCAMFAASNRLTCIIARYSPLVFGGSFPARMGL